MTKKTLELDTPYVAEGRLAPAEFRLRFIRIQSIWRLDALGCYWPPPWSDRYLRRLRRAWAKLAGR